MPKKIQDCTKAHLISVTLPIHGDTYTVISHQSVIDYVFTELATAGFVVTTEEYRATADGQIAQGIYKLNYNNDPELNMMFAWTNSYNKQVRFKCGVGAYINKTGTVMVCGDMGSWARKHTGTADTETIATIKEQIAGAQMYYDQLVSDKEQMKTVVLNKRRQAQMLGILFAEYQIITTEQASMIRNQMDRPSHVYDDSNSLWAFYNYVTIALQHSHPKTWMEDQRVLHYFMSSINNFAVAPAPVVVPVVIEAEVEFVDPNQTNLLNQIADMEADQMDEDIRYEADEKLVTYTDPAGNTFETIDFHNAVTADPEDDDDDELNIWTEQHIITKEEESFEIDENQEWTGENAKTMSIAVSPEERDLAERELILSDERDAEQNSNFDSLDFSISITEDDNEDEEDITSDFF
jgi:hypothetical protein